MYQIWYRFLGPNVLGPAVIEMHLRKKGDRGSEAKWRSDPITKRHLRWILELGFLSSCSSSVKFCERNFASAEGSGKGGAMLSERIIATVSWYQQLPEAI